MRGQYHRINQRVESKNGRSHKTAPVQRKPRQNDFRYFMGRGDVTVPRYRPARKYICALHRENRLWGSSFRGHGRPTQRIHAHKHAYTHA